MLESKVQDRYQERAAINQHETELVEREGCLAICLIEKWGMVACDDDGEDSAGRSKCRLQTPQELVDRAFEVANIAFTRLHKDELIHKLPTIQDMEDYAEAIKNKDDE